ncbi:MAG: type II secretion system F family protein, partial [candidate division NC10 bacterium]|nr:type II secretion system F family protein [candidate division NC10 bacterium]
MPVFAYSGRTRQGQVVSGEMEAANPEAVVATLRRQQIITTSVRAKPKDIEITIPGFGGKVSEKEIAIFTRQFSTMIDAGLPLVQCLEILASQQVNKTFQKVLVELRQDIESGTTL